MLISKNKKPLKKSKSNQKLRSKTAMALNLKSLSAIQSDVK